jgi:hypothetical protein
MTGKRVDAVIIQGSILRKEAVDLAMKHRLPSLSSYRLGPGQGGLMSYTANRWWLNCSRRRDGAGKPTHRSSE